MEESGNDTAKKNADQRCLSFMTVTEIQPALRQVKPILVGSLCRKELTDKMVRKTPQYGHIDYKIFTFYLQCNI